MDTAGDIKEEHYLVIWARKSVFVTIVQSQDWDAEVEFKSWTGRPEAHF
jgi:predicted alpha/beta hydrolase family esterase